jgi:hypothetical protein
LAGAIEALRRFSYGLTVLWAARSRAAVINKISSSIEFSPISCLIVMGADGVIRNGYFQVAIAQVSLVF